jgi:hypothetical protein
MKKISSAQSKIFDDSLPYMAASGQPPTRPSAAKGDFLFCSVDGGFMRGSSTLPGTLQIRVTADKQDTEDFSQKLGGFLKSSGYVVVSQSTDFQDKADQARAIFHTVAVPRVDKPTSVQQENTDGTD